MIEALNSRTVADLLGGCQDSDRDYKCFAYPEGTDSQHGFRYFTAPQLGQLTRTAATYYVEKGVRPRQVGEMPLVIALLARGTPEWAASFFALIRMGHSVILLSPRLVQSYIGALLDRSKSTILITDQSISQITGSIQTIPIITSRELQAGPLTTSALNSSVFCDPSAIHDTDIVFAGHSSGSTSCPKLLPKSHAGVMLSYRLTITIYPPDKKRWFASAMYNTVGLRALITSVYFEKPVFFENDLVPFTAESVVAFAKEAQVDEMYLSPYTLTLLASTPEGVAQMKRANLVSIFGAVPSDAVGDRLVRQGINLAMQYGMSETMLTLISTGRKPGDREEWQWMELIPVRKQWMEMQPIDGQEGYHELVCKKGCPDVMESAKEKDGTLRTGDVFVQHPDNKDRWKIIGRKDDQIKLYRDDRQVLVNANTYEHKIAAGNEDVVKEVVLFGQGRGKLGVLAFVDRSCDREEVEKRLWRAIEKEVNASYYIGIERQMIVLVDTDRAKLPQTGKYNLIRSRIYRDFEQEIDEAYKRTIHAGVNGHANGEINSHM